MIIDFISFSRNGRNITINYPTIYDIVSLSTDHTTLETAVDACGLDVALSSSGSKTLFAPTDAAFSLLLCWYSNSFVGRYSTVNRYTFIPCCWR